MLKKFGAVGVLVLTVALVVPACTADVADSEQSHGTTQQPEDIAEAEEALLVCNSDCDCPLGRWCNTSNHKCYSSNFPPDTCWADCQCGGGLFCCQGTCSTEPCPQCYSDCDCPVTHICGGDGICHSWFGPYPECRGCDNHCWPTHGIYSYCQDYYCIKWG